MLKKHPEEMCCVCAMRIVSAKMRNMHWHQEDMVLCYSHWITAV